ncbi:NAD(P)/FAD-dependent oxidoreductase [Candidatus Thiothrix anitrata]|uniref:NAD(P)-binding protein n=1 Tax=Candidatus Thiothrix anitrata TaxID=2823902 RepID=A0ABX7X772_9GAMM|nr:NAD(P)-binding protein [Candidatus Thiothrix anitrata]QTR49155.1 NAD(P)-binding protein [Candidatus Thiothrix anitrata]
MKVRNIGIIGSGITGLACAWLLHKQYNITVFEKNAYIGGHTHTIDVPEQDRQIPVDTGFIVYNDRNYPNLIGLFAQLGISTRDTDMSFGFSLNQGELEYSGSSLNTLFAQRKNLFRLSHWRLLKEIMRFNKVAHRLLANPVAAPDMSLGEMLDAHQFSRDMREHYLLPMGAAIWSCPVDTMLAFPALSFLRFFANHGLIDIQNRPQWRTVCGGSSVYVRKLLAEMGDKITIQSGAIRVERSATQASVFTDTAQHDFDAVIFACHADEALALLAQPSAEEQRILGCFRYEKNQTYLHTDANLMPVNRKVWSSWNYLATSQPEYANARQQMTATYWMNNLQGLDTSTDYFVTLNPYQLPRDSHIIAEMTYEHPIFDQAAVAAQPQLASLQGQQQSWFCGSYHRYGFHEDAIASAVKVCTDFGVIPVWVKAQEEPKTPQPVLPLSIAGAVTP